MIPLVFIFVILLAHWVGDFFLQSHWMATNKSKSIIALSAHVLTYTLTIAVFAGVASYVFGYSGQAVAVWAILNGVIHFIIDYFSSRLTSKLWQKQEYHKFFVVIGADQMVHYVCLFVTAVPLLLSVTAG